MDFLFIINLILLVGLIILIIYESRQLKEYKDTMALFIESNSEIFGVVNVNAGVSREQAERLNNLEKTMEFFKVVLDAHAHVLRIYGPAFDFLENPLSDKIQSSENFGE